MSDIKLDQDIYLAGLNIGKSRVVALLKCAGAVNANRVLGRRRGEILVSNVDVQLIDFGEYSVQVRLSTRSDLLSYPPDVGGKQRYRLYRRMVIGKKLFNGFRLCRG